MRLIDISGYEKFWNKARNSPAVSDDYDLGYLNAVADAYDWMDEQQPIDAVPVVRCKDCRWGNCYDNILLRYECLRLLGSIQVKEDDFCSYGERRADNA